VKGRVKEEVKKENSGFFELILSTPTIVSDIILVLLVLFLVLFISSIVDGM